MPVGELRPYCWMLGSAFAFTGMGALARGLEGQVPWATTALVRSVVALGLAAALVWQARVPFAVLRPASLWLRSLAGSCSLVCTFYALQKLPLATTLTLTHMSPLWIAALSWPLLGRAPGRGVVLAAAVAVAGMALVNRPGSVPHAWAAWSAVAASLCTGFAMIGLHLVKDLDPRAVVAHFSAVGTAFAFVACGGAPELPGDLGLWLRLLGVGACATLGQLLMTKAYSQAEPARVSVVGLTQTLFALLVDILWWGVRPDRWTLLGMALVLAPTAWVMASRRPAPPPSEVAAP